MKSIQLFLIILVATGFFTNTLICMENGENQTSPQIINQDSPTGLLDLPQPLLQDLTEYLDPITAYRLFGMTSRKLRETASPFLESLKAAAIKEIRKRAWKNENPSDYRH